MPPYHVSLPVSFAPGVNVGNHRPRDSTGRFLPRSDSHRSTHDESADSPRMHNEPGSSSRDGQPINVDAPDHVVLPRDVEMPSGEFEVGAHDASPNFQLVSEQFFEEHPLVEPQLQSSPCEPPLPPPRRRITTQQFQRNVRARQSNFECSLSKLKGTFQ